MGESWIVSNLNAALSTWNDKLAEIWSLLTESPQTFKGGQVWGVMTGIHGALQAIGYGLLVLFFAVGVMKTCGSFVEVKKPEHALKPVSYTHLDVYKRQVAGNQYNDFCFKSAASECYTRLCARFPEFTVGGDSNV